MSIDQQPLDPAVVETAYRLGGERAVGQLLIDNGLVYVRCFGPAHSMPLQPGQSCGICRGTGYLGRDGRGHLLRGHY